MKASAQYRQGDLLFIQIDTGQLPRGAKRLLHRVLAEGEQTGHRHQVLEDDVVLVQDEEKLFLEVPNGGTVVHEEHGPIALPEGLYEVRRQKQYKPDETSYVQD